MMELTFKGNWPDEFDEDGNFIEKDDTEKWETFSIRLFGNEVGDFIDDPSQIRATLARAGLRLVEVNPAPD